MVILPYYLLSIWTRHNFSGVVIERRPGNLHNNEVHNVDIRAELNIYNINNILEGNRKVETAYRQDDRNQNT
jgi:hypothetical protein